MTPISAVIITLNNERSLEKTLQSLQWADEIIVVDSGSTDQTLKISESFGCNIFHHRFEGFGKQKHYAVNQAKNDWVLVIDADEVCTPEFISELKSKVGKELYHSYKIPISLVFMGKLLKYGGEYKMLHLRLFNKKFGQYNDREVHEDVVMQDKNTASLHNHLLHYSYADLHQYFEKFNTYTTKAAEQLHQKNRKANLLLSPFRFTFSFLKRYIIKGMILDGPQGFIWSLLSAFYTEVKYIKLYERQLSKRLRQDTATQQK